MRIMADIVSFLSVAGFLGVMIGLTKALGKL